MNKSNQFCIFVCVISWAIAWAAYLFGMQKAEGLGYVIFAACFMCLPAITAVILQLIHKEKPFRNLNVSFKFNRWFIIAGLVPVVLTFLTLAVNLMFPGVSFSASYEGLLSMIPEEQRALAAEQLSAVPQVVFLFVQIGQGIIAGYTINALFAFGEEFGWRGYLLKALSNKSFISVSIITGFVWGIWHFPLILIGHNYPEHPVHGVGMMIVFCILLSPVMTYITIKSKSVITAAIFHGTINAVASLPLVFIAGGNDLINSATGLSGFIAMILITLSFFFFDRYITKENIFTKSVNLI